MADTQPKQIGLHADVGESYGHFRVGQDATLMPYLSSCNIACGFHGGDPSTMMQTILLAQQHRVRIGAHPGFADLRGFGRQAMQIPMATLMADTIYQISALQGMAQSLGSTVAYVKPHGALYHLLMQDEATAEAFTVAVRQVGNHLSIMGLPDSALQQACQAKGVAYEQEGFLDRRYLASGELAPRGVEGAVIHDPQEAQDQLMRLLTAQQIPTMDGQPIPLTVDTLCIHGDNPQALAIVQITHQTLTALGWSTKP